MRKYTLANATHRATVDLRNYADIITEAVEEFAPGATMAVHQHYYTVKEPLTQGQAVRIGRKICQSSLSQYCISLPKLFCSSEIKEVAHDEPEK